MGVSLYGKDMNVICIIINVSFLDSDEIFPTKKFLTEINY